jgi:hypothetical protein
MASPGPIVKSVRVLGGLKRLKVQDDRIRKRRRRMVWVIDRGNDSERKILGERRRKRVLAKLGHTFPGMKILDLIRKRDQEEEELRARGPGKRDKKP